MAGRGKSLGTFPPTGTTQRGTGRPAAWSTAFTTALLWQMVMVQDPAPVKGIPNSSNVPATWHSHRLTPPMPSQRLNTNWARRT